ncbi:hypothetical protein BpHYR1_007822 [Brachionus plicatilis]|uniref:Uncharacterized protein n=1 Tax=Brachionus plicatilis TaxID=10195 RepID=A0A3M7T4N1_BRAPC|nr:hypothetical protein BpHYR1_007822 [Brachionus plicatilis]
MNCFSVVKWQNLHILKSDSYHSKARYNIAPHFNNFYKYFKKIDKTLKRFWLQTKYGEIRVECKAKNAFAH